GLRLKVDRRALIPRPETELLVEHVVAAHATPPARVLDLGTGSGAIALALARAFPTAEATATDVSADALVLARENADACGLTGRVSFVESNWFAALPAGASFDVIVSNPPYLSADETAATAPEVRNFEPAQALTAEGDGLAALTEIIGSASRYLAEGGLLALETGIAQHEALLARAADAGFARAESRPDLTQRPRYIFARR
ncbi:MAG TPA: peptide chain release factor N(5)-glutamine methyltransferase, partial [Opitutaceae bacterium]|nr:peptide chain release factor N(5)-glutamine methyltransferase [Opitutaceae bacterium]